MQNEDYSTLISYRNEPVPKPTLQQVLVFDQEATTYWAQQAKNERIRNALAQDGLVLYNIVLNLTKAVREIRTKAALRGGQSLTTALDTALTQAETDLNNLQNL